MLRHVFLRTFFCHKFINVYTFYDLYFDGIDDDDDNGDEHVGDFDAFSPEHSQYLAFSFDGGGLGWLGDKGLLDRISMYIFFYSIHVLTLVIEAYNWMKKKYYTLPIY